MNKFTQVWDFDAALLPESEPERFTADFELPAREAGAWPSSGPMAGAIAGVLGEVVATPKSAAGPSQAISPQHNGDQSLSESVAGSSDQRINGLLGGVKWSGSSVSFGWPENAAGYQEDHAEAFNGFEQLTSTQMAVVRYALDADGTTPAAKAGLSVEGFTNLGFTAAGATADATLRFANVTDADTAYAYYPSESSVGGDVFMGGSGASPVVGNYDYTTILHEIGHALGLKHGHDTDEGGALPYATDSMEYSIMTYKSHVGTEEGYYNEDFGFAQTFMMYDIAALQYLYGADYTTNADSTVYGWSATTGEMSVNGAEALSPGENRVFATIWDGGGSDTYDLSNYATNLKIDLTPGGHSTFSSAQLAYLGGGPNDGYARGNVFNALLHDDDERSLIENAFGGTGNDRITGNAANNYLDGGAGGDSLIGGAGSDILDGGTGNDSMTGGAGDDFYCVQSSLDKVVEASGGGTDTVQSAVSFVLTGYAENLALGQVSTALTAAGNGLGNYLTGNTYANTLRGLAGADRIEGGNGADILTGGTGADSFIFIGSSSSTAAKCDIIRAGDSAIAFELAGVSGGDRIDLSGYDANTETAGIQDFSFGTSTAKGKLWAVNSGTTTVIRGNVDSDSVVEFELRIEDGSVLASAYKAVDFIL